MQPPPLDAPERLRVALAEVASLRQTLAADEQAWARRQALRRWQSERLRATHADLLASARYGAAAEFFLSELYGPGDSRQRDADVARVLPTMVRLLPERALAVLADAIELDALSEQLDLAMARYLHAALDSEAAFDADAWCAAYRAVGDAPARQRQLDCVAAIGRTLDELARHRSIGRVLSMMRMPARLAGFAALQSFLERGFEAFAAMQGADEFLALIIGREQRVCAQLFAGDSDPFVV